MSFPWNQLLSGLIVLASVLFLSRKCIYYFQLSGYQFHDYFKTVRRQWKQAWLPALAVGAVYFLVVLLGSLFHWGLNPAVIPVCFLAWTIYNNQKKQKEKKPFGVSARVKRLVGFLAAITSGLLALIYFTMNGDLFLPGALICVTPLLVALAAALVWPVERIIYECYFQSARRKLMENPRLIRIGITGSYGKTSTKVVLTTLLSQKYNVLTTPRSFNIPMSLARVIRERLTPAHQVFIGEMGARHPGDIKELCRLVKPQIGVLTAVGPQHLDTFKTLDRIKNTKYDLIRALPKDGFAVLAHDDGIVTELYQQTEKPKALAGLPGSEAWADNIRLSANGSKFTLHLQGWDPFDCETRLLGQHNISNILMSAAVSQHLGLSPAQIARGIAQLEPVEHRLQLLRTAGDITVIDDAFNTNPTSSHIALDVLASFPGRRIIITPGMVELGKEEAQYNRGFGEYMANKVDIAVLVGPKHTRPIYEGLLSQGFPADNIRVVTSLDEALELNKTLLRPGDVVMYENDLPDHYNEG